ncbi:CaiB/BaiF CoA transferase family protein [Nonomuraea jiangxiensis]|uniref:CoA:oxalate CoA-transferase n=1 Tax=Nonomuraea jiangxiensis TaxID=633440 RepID=A0A1G9FE91_9ACTN|nr:CoA transferase [Nonomuraea jiangxiensis]SDK86662.1 CoA:oxalate CoA-transferase [Nonomuraea jiangxiensis]
MTTQTTTHGAAVPAEHLDPSKPHALEHITVVDFTRVLAGPTCTRMLADAGARIIKVERPGTGDDTRQMGPFASDGTSEYYRFANLGKESIALNLKDPGDLGLVKAMIAEADVVVENFRPGVMAKLGLDPVELVRRHPRLIVCSISGFGQYGPLHLEAAYDTVIQAVSGIMDATGAPDGGPTRVGTSISDILGGIFGYCGIVTALVARERTGKGTTVDVAMLDATFSTMEQGLMDALGIHQRPERIGNRHPSMAPFDTYSCADQLIAICVGNDHLFAILADTLGKPELAADSRFATNVDRTNNQAELKQAMEAVLRTDSAAAWHGRLEDAGIPASLVLNVDDTRRLEHIKVRGMVKEVDGFQVPGNPIKFGAYNSLGTMIPSPELDNRGDALRAEFAPGDVPRQPKGGDA